MTLPTIEEISRMSSDAERANWLMRAPDSIVFGWVASIRAELERSVFPEGVAYLERRFASTMAIRTPEGHLPHSIVMGVYHAEGVMRDAARRRDRSVA